MQLKTTVRLICFIFFLITFFIGLLISYNFGRKSGALNENINRLPIDLTLYLEMYKMSEFIESMDVDDPKSSWSTDNMAVLLFATISFYDDNIDHIPDAMKQYKYFSNRLDEARSIVEAYEFVGVNAESIKQEINK